MSCGHVTISRRQTEDDAFRPMVSLFYFFKRVFRLGVRRQYAIAASGYKTEVTPEEVDSAEIFVSIFGRSLDIS